jgi:hypothetical protein
MEEKSRAPQQQSTVPDTSNTPTLTPIPNDLVLVETHLKPMTQLVQKGIAFMNPRIEMRVATIQHRVETKEGTSMKWSRCCMFHHCRDPSIYVGVLFPLEVHDVVSPVANNVSRTVIATLEYMIKNSITSFYDRELLELFLTGVQNSIEEGYEIKQKTVDQPKTIDQPKTVDQ